MCNEFHEGAPPAASLRSPQPPCASLRSGGGQTWRWVCGWWPAHRDGFAECEDMPPALRAAPPGLVGFLARIWASRFASGAFMKLIADLEAPQRKTPTLKKPPDRPTPGGSAAGAGGLSHLLLDPQQATLWATNHAPNAKSAPLLRRSRNTGGPRTSDSEGRGGRDKQSTDLYQASPRMILASSRMPSSEIEGRLG